MEIPPVLKESRIGHLRFISMTDVRATTRTPDTASIGRLAASGLIGGGVVVVVSDGVTHVEASI